MTPDNFNADEQLMIQRLQSAPQPMLSPRAFDAIQARLMDALDNPIPPVKPGITLSVPMLIALVIGAIAIGIMLVLVIINLQVIPPTPTQTPTHTLTATSTNTPTQTWTTTYTITPSPTSSPTIAVTYTPTASATIQLTNTPTTTQTPLVVTTTTTPSIQATSAPIIVIEGNIERIEGNTITIYGIPITLDSDDNILTVIQVGDTIRIEGDYVNNVLVVIQIVILTDRVTIEPTTGATWVDSGTCANPPPPWAPANGWRRRCEGGGSNQGNNGGGNNNTDDDDDDGEGDD
jgi:hypothetical protein